MPCAARITLRNGRVLNARDYGIKAFCWGDDKVEKPVAPSSQDVSPQDTKMDSPEEESIKPSND